MKKILLIFLLFFGVSSFSQSSICDIAAGCSDTPLVFPNVFDGSDAEVGPNYDCLLTQPNPAWYFLGVDVAGDLEIEISQQNLSGVGIDVDFICWGPFNDPFIACNNLTVLNSSSQIDCSYSESATETLNISNAQVGQFYILLITNFDGSQGNITMTQTNQGDPNSGSTDCSYACSVDLGEDKTLCYHNDLTLTATLGNDSMSDSATYKWYKNNVEIAGETNETYEIVGVDFDTSDTYRVEVEADLCDDLAVDEIEVTYNNVVDNLKLTNVSDIINCDANNDGFVTFDLNSNNNEIANTEDANDYNFTFYKDAALTQQINNPSSYTNSSAYSETIYVTIIHNTFIGCEAFTQFDINVYDTPDANQLVDWVYCDDDNDGFSSFDLDSLKTGVLNGQTANDYTISFHHTQNDADNGDNAISSSYTNNTAFTSEEIYVRIENVNHTDCYDVSMFNINVIIQPTSTQLDDWVYCDDDNDGFYEFDLDSLKTDVLNGQASNDYTISFHHTQNDADNGDDAISSSYTNNTAFTSEEIYVRIENVNHTDCYDVSMFNINVIIQPTSTQLDDWVYCDDDNDGFYSFDLDSLKTDVLNGQAANDYTISFHHSQNDADNDNLEISSPYINNTAFTSEEIYIRIENNNHTDCYDVSMFNINVVWLPVSTQIDNWYQCDDEDNDGFYEFDLSILNNDLLNGQDPDRIGISYYHSEVDAEDKTLPLDTNYTNQQEFTEEEIFVRLENVEKEDCFTVTSFKINVFENPIFDIIEDTKYICTNLTNQVTTFELENIKDNYTFSWKDSNENELSTTTTLDVTEIGDYTITATTINGNNCSITKTVHLLPAESAEIIDFEINEYWQHDNFSIDLEIKGDGIFQYAIDDINGPYQDDSVIVNVSPGVHTIFVKEIHDCGITSKTMNIFGFRSYFSPNGDGKHDIWEVQGINFKPSEKIYIFDRFGKVIYQFYPALNQGWNGIYNGKLAPEGEYWFTAEMKDFKGKSIIRKGHFSLKRTNK